MATVTYYFDAINSGETFGVTDSANAVDGNTATFATGDCANEYNLFFSSTTCDGSDLGTITAVEWRAYAYRDASAPTDLVDALFGTFAAIGTSAAWTEWVDLSASIVYYNTWAEIRDGVFGFYYGFEAGNHYIAKVELRVTYTEGATGQPIQIRGTLVPGASQWQPGRGPGF